MSVGSAVSDFLVIVGKLPFSLEAWALLIDPWGMGSWGNDFSLFLLLWILATPAAFLALVETLRKHKARHVHLLRALAYSLPLVVAAHWACAIASAGTRLYEDVYGSAFLGGITHEFVHVLAVSGEALVMVAWLLAWCLAFVLRYLRIPHGVLTVFIMLFVSLLFSMVVTMYVHV